MCDCHHLHSQVVVIVLVQWACSCNHLGVAGGCVVSVQCFGFMILSSRSYMCDCHHLRAHIVVIVLMRWACSYHRLGVAGSCVVSVQSFGFQCSGTVFSCV